METLYNDRIVPLDQIKQISDLYAVNIVDTTHKIRNRKIRAYDGLKSIELAEIQIKEIWGKYLSTTLVKDEEEIINEIKPLMQKANMSINELKTILKNDDMKRLDKYVVEDMYSEIDPVTADIAKLITVQLKVSKAVFDKSENEYSTNIQIFSVLVIISLMASLFLASYTSKQLNNQISGLVVEMKNLSEGNLKETGSIKKDKSEIGLLVDSVAVTKHNLVRLIDDIDNLLSGGKNGDLTKRADAGKHSGSYSDLVSGINKTMDALVSPIQEATLVLSEMAKGNLKVRVNGQYKGDHAIVANAVNDTVSSFNSVLIEIRNASNQILQSSSQLADTSQLLANGSSEQASSLEEVTATIHNIENQTKQNAVKSDEANLQSKNVKDSAALGNTEMEKMVKAMQEINIASGSIAKIIKEIDAIAFQTNILALNAAVEAARAGEHGRGFNVVAEEVRNLASRSARAAQETANLIEETQKKITGGVEIAKDTAIALTEIVKGITRVNGWMDEIAIASKEQSNGITQLNTAISQISQVTMSNAASSEESASASQELQSQAEAFQTMLKRFTLDNRITI
jgi:methyl-accepting chemotaxis protein